MYFPENEINRFSSIVLNYNGYENKCSMTIEVVLVRRCRLCFTEMVLVLESLRKS